MCLTHAKNSASLRRKLALLTRSIPGTKIGEFANSVDLDEVAQHEPYHLDLHCMPSSL